MTPTILVYGDAADRYAALIRVPRRRAIIHTARTAGEAAGLIAEAHVLYAWNFPPELYATAARLTWLQAMGAGVEWALVPELPPCVTVTRAPGIFGPWIAEYVMGWCAWVTQRMALYLEAQRERRWISDRLPDRLRGRTLTVVGLGDVGRAVARAAQAFGMRVLGVSRSGRATREVQRVYAARHLTRALAQADFVVLTVPLTPDTRHLIGRRQLAAMKPEAWLVNVARGAVVDDTALIEALRAGHLAGAVLDVFTAEPLPPDHPFWSPSTPEEIAPVFNDNLARFLTGRKLRHLVDRARGY